MSIKKCDSATFLTFRHLIIYGCINYFILFCRKFFQDLVTVQKCEDAVSMMINSKEAIAIGRGSPISSCNRNGRSTQDLLMWKQADRMSM